MPWHLTTLETFRDIDRILRPEGLVVLNVIDYPPASLIRAEVATVMTVFRHVALVAPPTEMLKLSESNPAPKP